MGEANNNKAMQGMEGQYITFELGGETYGIAILKLIEIIGFRELTKIPNVPSFIKGILNLRGAAIPVIDLREHFHLQNVTYDSFTVIMILKISARTIGLIVDSVKDVVAFTQDQLRPAPRFNSQIKTDFIKAMGERDDKFVILLDIDRLLSDEELNVVDGV
ncbi:MAG: chemotaxis protein CheW [Deltaproteobacteria bacterium]|nr:chemotaxis protein CheW [Deltaproteobacteria bacterium]